MPYWEDSSDRPDKIKIADQLLWAYSQLSKSEAAEKVIEKLNALWPKNPEALATIGGYRTQQGRVDEAIGLFTEALAYASSPAHDFIALQLADIYYGRNEFSKAAELYESAADIATNNDLSRKYLFCLYNTGLHKEALYLAKLLRGDKEPIPFVSQIEANILRTGIGSRMS